MKEIVASLASAALAGYTGITAYNGEHSCDQLQAAYNTCMLNTITQTKARPALIIFELITNALTIDGSKSCPIQYKNFNACKDQNYTGTLVLISIASVIFATYSAFNYIHAPAIPKVKAFIN
ncbi:MAG: hypothetical protein H0X29_02745 [Parachlamydiaceae bacterium]|nr:hypothetical protein [Parachlamydiaceae bacterium]